MNLMFLIDTLGGGGAERACLNIALSLSAKYRVCVITVFDEPMADYGFSCSIPIETIGLRIEAPFHKKAEAYLKAVSKLRKLKKKYKTDCCISFLETANFLNGIAPAGEKKIISIRNYYSLSMNNESRKVRIIKAKIASKLADHIVGVSRAICADMARNYSASPEKMSTIYNMVTTYFGKSSEAYGGIYDGFRRLSAAGSVNFITIGRLSYQKGFRHLIRAFRPVAESIPGSRLFIFGEGDQEEALRNIIRKNHLEEHVFLPGFDPCIDRYLASADVYVCSSLYEGCSNAMLEAMDKGLPVISADCFSGPREILAPDTDCLTQTDEMETAPYGILVPVCSENRELTDEPLEPGETLLARAMIKTGSDPELRDKYGRMSLRRAQDFSEKIIVGKWEELIRKLC